MTIRQLHELTPADQEIYIGWDGSAQRLNRKDALQLDAFGAYVIANIIAMAENKIEADLKGQPVKEVNTL